MHGRLCDAGQSTLTIPHLPVHTCPHCISPPPATTCSHFLYSYCPAVLHGPASAMQVPPSVHHPSCHTIPPSPFLCPLSRSPPQVALTLAKGVLTAPGTEVVLLSSSQREDDKGHK